MGFGTLFIGYFLMLNITYFTFTDIISSLVMLLGLYKLSTVSRHFVRPMWAAVGLSVFSLGELAFGVYDIFSSADMSAAITYVGMARALVVAIFTVLMLLGLYGITKQLDVGKLPDRSRKMIAFSFLVYGLNILFSTPFITSILPPTLSALIYLAILCGMIAVVIVNLTVIYGCHMYICMPEDLKPKPEKPSRFAFVNEYRRRKAEREAAEAEEAKRRFTEKMAKRRKRK